MFHLSQTLPGLFLMHDSFITGFVTRLTRRVPLLDQELLTLPEHLSSPPVCSGVRVTRSLVLYVCFVDRCLSFGTFSFGHCVCLFFFDIRILITPLVSASSSFEILLCYRRQRNRRGNQEQTIQRNQQHWVHKTQDEQKQNKKTQHRKLKYEQHESHQNLR